MKLTANYVISSDEDGILTETKNNLKAFKIFLKGQGSNSLGDAKAIFEEIYNCTPKEVWSVPLTSLSDKIFNEILEGDPEVEMPTNKKVELAEKVMAYSFLIQRNAGKSSN